MRAIVYDGIRTHFDDSYPRPVPVAGEALIKVTLAALCNTDREIMHGYVPGFNAVMGHEFTGIVESVEESEGSSSSPFLSEAKDLTCSSEMHLPGLNPLNPRDLIGKRVVGEINCSCFDSSCPYCSTNRSSHCPQRTVAGIHNRDGCFADYITLPMRLLHIIPDDLPDKAAIFAEPLAAAIRIVEQSQILPQQSVALVGDGRLAYMIGQIIALTGAPLTVFGRHTEKLVLYEPFAQTRLLEKTAVGEQSASIDAKDMRGYEVVIDATGSPSGLDAAIALTRSGGLLVMKSTYASKVEIDMSEIVVREITIRGSRCGPFAPALRYLERGLIALPPVELFNPQDFESAFESAAFKAAFDFTAF
ncbi:MAG: alcohol dehydrogenase catalytic domain-containing protein [Coriobacteriia bacterium]|nr:alcohol dehydrogenase catalytic domain-containing protein [Coriobacteriia bacterium]